MKIKNKLITGTLLSIASLAIVGSVASTFAWYSYNTKDLVSYHGIATGNSENLQVRMTGTDDWKQSLKTADLVAWSNDNGFASNKLQPVSFAKTQAENKALEDFVALPTQGTNQYNTNGLKDSSGKKVWMETSFQLRCVNPGDGTLYAQNIYMSDITLYVNNDPKPTLSKDGIYWKLGDQVTTIPHEDAEVNPELLAVSDTTNNWTIGGVDTGIQGKRDISDSIRMHISSGTDRNYLIAPGIKDASNTKSINLFGELDLDNDGEKDKGIKLEGNTYRKPFEWEEEKAEKIVYGVKDVTETYYTHDAAVATYTDGKYTSGGLLVGTTTTTGSPLQVKLVVFLDGWAQSCVDANAEVEFDLGITFQCDVL